MLNAVTGTDECHPQTRSREVTHTVKKDNSVIFKKKWGNHFFKCFLILITKKRII